MKSYKDWQNKKLNEFIGPRGQLDPQNVVIPKKMMSNEQDPNTILQQLLDSMKNQPTEVVMDIQMKLNRLVQNLLHIRSQQRPPGEQHISASLMGL